jgi:Zn-dependent oligopeptidase
MTTTRCHTQVCAHAHCLVFSSLAYAAVVTQSATRSDDGQLSLSHDDVEVLFHEFGHALACILSRTDYQHVAGALCRRLQA